MPLAVRDAGPGRYEAPSLDALVRVDQRDVLNARHEEARRSGHELGYAEGMARAAADVQAAIDDHRDAYERCSRAADALESAVRSLAERDAITLTSIEDDVVELALALATEIVGRELRSVDEPVRDAIHRAIALAPDRGRASCHVHPDDAAVAQEVLAVDPLWHDRVDLVPDPRVEAGGCVLEIGDCRVDAQVATALQRLRAALA